MDTCRKNQQDTLLEKCLASIEFLRDDYIVEQQESSDLVSGVLLPEEADSDLPFLFVG